MSEFTAGVLYRAADAAAVETSLKGTGAVHLVSSVNATWKAFFTPDMFLMDNDTVRLVERVSHTAPLLFFWNAEDHGWGFRLFHQGAEPASYSTNFGMDLFEDLFEEDEAPFGSGEQGSADGTGAPPDQPAPPPALTAFAVFGLSDEALKAMTDALSPGSQERPWDEVDAFKQAMGIPEMSWMSYQYVLGDQN